MIERSHVTAGVVLATAISSATSATASARPHLHEPRYQQPLLVPGAVWSFDVELDLLHPEREGQTLDGTFTLTGQSDDQILVTWTMADERQVLSVDVFGNEISTMGISNAGSGIDLMFAPPLVHFDYPLVVGKKWGGQATFTGLLGGHPTTGTVTSAFEVVREERVTTPAGTFDTLVLVNDMEFPAFGQQIQATLWVSADGLLIQRESRINGVLVQAIALSDFDVPVSSMIEQTLLELELLQDRLRREQRDDPAVEAALRLAEHKLEHSLDRPRRGELEAARVALGLVAVRLRAQGVPHDAPVLVATRVIAHHISLTIERLDQRSARVRFEN